MVEFCNGLKCKNRLHLRVVFLATHCTVRKDLHEAWYIVNLFFYSGNRGKNKKRKRRECSIGAEESQEADSVKIENGSQTPPVNDSLSLFAKQAVARLSNLTVTSLQGNSSEKAKEASDACYGAFPDPCERKAETEESAQHDPCEVKAETEESALSEGSCHTSNGIDTNTTGQNPCEVRQNMNKGYFLKVRVTGQTESTSTAQEQNQTAHLRKRPGKSFILISSS